MAQAAEADMDPMDILQMETGITALEQARDPSTATLMLLRATGIKPTDFTADSITQFVDHWRNTRELNYAALVPVADKLPDLSQQGLQWVQLADGSWKLVPIPGHAQQALTQERANLTHLMVTGEYDRLLPNEKRAVDRRIQLVHRIGGGMIPGKPLQQIGAEPQGAELTPQIQTGEPPSPFQ